MPGLESEWADHQSQFEDIEITEHCAVLGLRTEELPYDFRPADIAYLALFAMQHRGQDASGILGTDGEGIIGTKGVGLVTNVFNDGRELGMFNGYNSLIGHNRYGTVDVSGVPMGEFHAAGPVLFDTHPEYDFGVSENGNLVNVPELIKAWDLSPNSITDVHAATDYIGQHYVDNGGDLVKAAMSTLPKLEGAFSSVLMDGSTLIGVRDPAGYRPLKLAQSPKGLMLVSEESAVQTTHFLNGDRFEFVRDVDPGEMIVIDGPNSYHTLRPFDDDKQKMERMCVFEAVYFMRPDSYIHGENVHAVRLKMGEELAKEAPANVDMVISVPESGNSAAEGFAQESGVHYGQGLVKNRYIARTFIAPSQELRAKMVRMKFNALKDQVEGKSIAVVDDSVVRGTTLRELATMLREAGAKEIHIRISSPPIVWPCFYGTNTPNQEGLIAANMSVDEIAKFLGVDSLAYLSQEGMLKATGNPDKFCTSCFDGDYKTPVPNEAPVEIRRPNKTNTYPLPDAA